MKKLFNDQKTLATPRGPSGKVEKLSAVRRMADNCCRIYHEGILEALKKQDGQVYELIIKSGSSGKVMYEANGIVITLFSFAASIETADGTETSEINTGSLSFK